MKFVLIALIFLALISQISAECNEGQIDINSASLEKLDLLSGIGPVKAQAIIDGKTYNSIEDLINVSGIGEVTLANIKTQNLACISDETENEEEDENSTEEINESEAYNDTEETLQLDSNQAEVSKKPITSEIILLTPENSKDIKTNSNVLASDNIAIYGLAAFSILLGVLFAAKKIKRHKTEFEEE